MKILADADLPDLNQLFPHPFEVTTYTSTLALHENLPTHDALICRSTLQVNEALLANSHLQCVGTASSGIDHIDQTYLAANNIQLFDAKGCNAHSVADYVTATLAWLETESKIIGKKAGVIGVGEVGTQVVERLKMAGYNVLGFDPYKTSHPALPLVDSISALADCDLLCIHANLHANAPFPTINLINHPFLADLKPGVVIINASRGGIVNEQDLIRENGRIYYCTDVYVGEPDINPTIIDHALLCTPHIAGHSIEAKKNAVKMLSDQLHEYLKRPLPDFDQPKHVDLAHYFIDKTAWQDNILQLYNPFKDTQFLKEQIDKTKAFITQRRAHTYRHDFANS